jgi:hypothetical protein
MGEHVTAHVEQDDAVAAEPLRRVVQRCGDCARTRVRVDQHGLRTRGAGDVRLAEQKATGAARVRAAERDRRVQRLGADHLCEQARPRDRVDRPALPGEPADDGFAAEQLSSRERADDVPAAADAHDQRAWAVGGGRNGDR